jgi:hypothetical protein
MGNARLVRPLICSMHGMFAKHAPSQFRTYQEGVLPLSRLVFTRSQVYFQCLKTHACESISGYLVAEEDSWNPESEEFRSLRNNMQVFPPLYLTHARQFQIELRICGYLQQTLTYESDILNAFMGVLRHFWYQDPPIYHFWGLPFSADRNQEQELGSRVLASLFWIPRPSTIPPTAPWKGTRPVHSTPLYEKRSVPPHGPGPAGEVCMELRRASLGDTFRISTVS